MSKLTAVPDPQPACLRERGEPWACGSHSTYNNHNCRGDACRSANVAFNREQRERRRDRMVAGEVSPTHGKESTYFNYMCRCDACRSEHNRREAERRLIRKSRSSVRVTAIAGMEVATEPVDDALEA